MDFATRSNPMKGYKASDLKFPDFAPKYAKEIDKATGREKVVLVGKTNFQEQIQSSVQDTLIYNIIDRIQRTGDFTDAHVIEDQIVDATVFPRGLLEAEQVKLQCKQFYNSLSADVRQKVYGNSFEAFVKDINSKLQNKEIKTRDEILAAMAKKNDPEVTPNG